MKKSLLILLIFISHLHANSFSEVKKKQGCCENILSYNAPARIETQGSWDIITSAGFIYWTAKQVGLDLGISTSNDLTAHPSIINTFDTDFYPGFTALLGTNFHYDNWSADIKYIRFHFKEKETQDTPNWASGQNYNPYTEAELFSFIKNKWKQKLDFFDLTIGRPYYNGKNLVIKPNVAARGGFAKQSFAIRGSASDICHLVKLKSKSWFLGPEISVGFNWLFTYNFSIFVNTAACLLYQKFETDYWYNIFSTPEVLTRNLQAKTKQITPNFDLKCGLGWSSYLDHNWWHIDLLITYDFLYFWNQNEFTAVQDFRDYFNYHASGDLMLHGIEISLIFNF